MHVSTSFVMFTEPVWKDCSLGVSVWVIRYVSRDSDNLVAGTTRTISLLQIVYQELQREPFSSELN